MVEVWLCACGTNIGPQPTTLQLESSRTQLEPDTATREKHIGMRSHLLSHMLFFLILLSRIVLFIPRIFLLYCIG